MYKIVNVMDPECISQSCNVLDDRGIIIVPTIRWYMIVTRADNEMGVADIFAAKDRSRIRQPLFVVPDNASIQNYFLTDKYSDQLIKQLMPGELTLRMNWIGHEIAQSFSVNHDNALVYVATGIFGEITKAIKVPLAATTPNVSSDTNSFPALSCSEAERFISETNARVSLIVDGGLSVVSVPTTIVDCTNLNDVHGIEREGFVCSRLIQGIQRNCV